MDPVRVANGQSKPTSESESSPGPKAAVRRAGWPLRAWEPVDTLESEAEPGGAGMSSGSEGKFK